jgi:hypothetical protein
MERVVRKFSSFEEAEEADWEEYRRMTPDERVASAVELWRWWVGEASESSERLERVARVVPLSEC